MKDRIAVIKADITTLSDDIIVNAANNSLLGGGGVDGAIHRTAGPELLVACKKLNGCPSGGAKITPAFNLPSKWVIHTVGPVWHGGFNNEERILISCYKQSLKLAKEKNAESLVFPNISTGIYRYPKKQAAEIAVNTVFRFLEQNNLPTKVTFCCFDEENFSLYRELLAETSAEE